MIARVWEMRGVPLVLIAVSVLAILPSTIVSPANPQPTDASLIVRGSTACYTTGLTCTFTIEVRDPALIFFRWDLDADGGWDYPGPGSDWTSGIALTVDPWSPYYDPAIPRVCAQGWDGVSTVDEGGVLVPKGPISCTDPSFLGTIVMRPGQWSRHSAGRWVTAFLELPESMDPGSLVVGSVSLEGIPAVAMPRDGWRAGGNGVAGWMFKVDRAALTERLGPGTHTVRLQGEWTEGTFTAVDRVTIL